MSPKVTTGFPLTNTDALVLVVEAAQCTGGHPLAPQQGCGVTFDPMIATGRLLTKTEASPLRITPPAVFLSPTRHTSPGMCYPIKILLFRTGLIPVVASI